MSGSATEEKDSELRVPIVREQTYPVRKKRTPTLLIVGAVVGMGALIAYLVLAKSDDGPKTGSIQVNSTPQEAKVYLDGSDTGKTTNCTLTDLSPGSHAIKLVKDGYVDYTETVNVVAGQTVPINATLVPHTISVTQPTASTAWVKGFTTGEIRWAVDGALAAQSHGTTVSSPVEPNLDQQRRIARLAGAERTSMMTRDPATGVLGDRSSESVRVRGRDRDISRSAAPGSQAIHRDIGRGIPALQPESHVGAPPVGNIPLDAVDSMSEVLDIANMKIELYKGTAFAVTIAEEASNTGSYSWPVPDTLADGNDYKVRVSCSTDSGIYGESPNFTVSEASVVVTFPIATSVFERGKSYTLTWTSNLPSENVKIELFKAGTLSTTIAAATPNDGSHNWTLPGGLAEGADYSIEISTLTSGISGSSADFIIANKGVTYQMHWQPFNRPSGITPRQSMYLLELTTSLSVAERGANRVSNIRLADNQRTYTTDSLNAPTGLHYFRNFGVGLNFTDQLVIADTGNNRVVRMHGTPPLSRNIPGGRPVDITFHQGYFYVLNRNLGNVMVISSDLTTLELTYPLGGQLVAIARHSGLNNFYVTDAGGGGQVRAFSTSFAPTRSWTLNYEPGGIACSPAGFVYVADRTNKRIVKYAFDGREVATFSHTDTNLIPVGLCIFDSSLFVVYENSMFHTNGAVYRYNW